MKQTGEKLRAVREDKGLSIHEISLSLKINSKILKAIEEGETSNLPAKTFLRGFVQSYANYLNMNTSEILSLFHEEMGSTRPQPILNPVEAISPESTEPSKNSETHLKNETAVAIEKVNAKNQFKAIAISGIMLVLAFLIYLVNSQIERYTKEAQIISSPNDEDLDDLSSIETTSPAKEASKHLIEPNSTTTESLAPTPPTLTPAPVVAPAAAPTIASPPPAVVKPTPPVVPAPVVPPPAPKPISPPTAAPTPVTPAAQNSIPKPPLTAVVSPLPTKTMSIDLIVEALEPLEIQYSTNSEPSKFSKIQLKAEQVHTFKSKNGLNLNLSNGGAANLILNGKDLGVPGKQGQSIQLKY